MYGIGNRVVFSSTALLTLAVLDAGKAQRIEIWDWSNEVKARGPLWEKVYGTNHIVPW
jgi:hypothetical protein